MLENIISGTKNLAKKTLLPLAVVTAGMGAGKDALANRYVNFDADPAIFGVAGETIDPSEFQVQYFSTEDPNQFGFRVFHPNKDYVEIRGIIPLADGETFTLDGIGLFPYFSIDPSTLGNPGFSQEMPGSNPGVDNIYELDASMETGTFFGLPFIESKKTFAFDLDSDYVSGHIDLASGSVEKWRVPPAGYESIGDLANFTTYHSSQGEPEGYNAGEHKVWKIQGIETDLFRGHIEIGTDTILFSRSGATESTFDEEVFSAEIVSTSSPFANQIVPSIPEAYKQLNVLQNFSNIYNAISGVQVPVVRVDKSWETYGFNMFTPNADDGSGVFPGSVNLVNLVQEDSLNSEGSAISTITQPPVATEKTSLDGIKAMFRDATR